MFLFFVFTSLRRELDLKRSQDLLDRYRYGFEDKDKEISDLKQLWKTEEDNKDNYIKKLTSEFSIELDEKKQEIEQYKKELHDWIMTQPPLNITKQADLYGVPLTSEDLDKIKKLAKKIKISSDFNNGLEFFETNPNYNIDLVIQYIDEIINETNNEYKNKMVLKPQIR